VEGGRKAGSPLTKKRRGALRNIIRKMNSETRNLAPTTM
jgi:hypothetical protein